jgi:hypothetical protein
VSESGCGGWQVMICPLLARNPSAKDPVLASVEFYHRNPLDTKISAVVIEN